LRPVHRIAVRHIRLWSGVLAGIAIFVLAPAGWSPLTRLLTGWNAGVLLFLVLVYVWMSRLDAEDIHSRYSEDDPSAPVILLVVVIAALLSLAAIVAMLAAARQDGHRERGPHIVLATATIVESWVLVATMFTLHYADAFYSASLEDPPLQFPRTARPVFWDFVYFSFTIAAACQTSDVSTTQAAVRRLVTAQTLVAFIFNVSIVGFAVNVSAGLLGA